MGMSKEDVLNAIAEMSVMEVVELSSCRLSQHPYYFESTVNHQRDFRQVDS